MPAPQYKGQTLPVYSVAPNWRERVRLRTIYGTHVREKLDLSETRYGRQPRSLFGLQYTTLPLDGQETGYIRRVMELAQGLPVIMPVWTEASKLTVASGIGDTLLTVDDTYPTLLSVLYDYVIVWQDYKTWEILALASFDNETLTLTDPVGRVYPVGTLVMPILIGDLKRPPASQLTDEHGQHNVQFVEVFNGGLTDQSVVEDFSELTVFETYLSYTDACRAEFVLTIPDLEPSTTYELQISGDGENWYSHIFFELATPEEEAAGTKVLTINNDYNAEVMFRVALNGEPLSTPGVPEASAVAAPTVAIAGVVDVSSTRPMWNDGGFTYPYSMLENAFISPSGTYIVPRGRYEKSTVDTTVQNWADLNQTVTLTGEAGATHKFTRDGNDPTETTLVRRLDGYDNNAAVVRNDFAYVVRARSFKDGCRSPQTCILVDKRIGQRGWTNSAGTAQATVGLCDHTRNDGSGIYESGASCLLNWGSPELFEDHQGDAIFAVGAPANGGRLIYSRGQSFQDRIDWLGWLNHVVSTNFFDFGVLTHNRSALTFDPLPNCYTFVQVSLADSLVAAPFTSGYLDSTVFGATIATPAGVSAPFAESASIWIAEKLEFYNDLGGVWEPGSHNPVYLCDYWCVLTLHHDFKFFRDSGYAPPAPRTLPPIETVHVDNSFVEDWENYAETSNADIEVLNEGTGWSAAWVIMSMTTGLGGDPFEAYATATEYEFTSTLDSGELFGGPWTLDRGSMLDYRDDFESYANNATMDSYNFNGGTGWGGAWEVADPGGLEDWESFADLQVMDGTNVYSGVLWVGGWVINS